MSITRTGFGDVLAAIKGALSATPALAGGAIGSNLTRPIPQGQSTGIVLRLENSPGKETAIGAMDWDTAIAIECHARATSGTDPLDAVDTLLSSTWSRIAAMTDEQLGGSLRGEAAIDWQFGSDETPTVAATVHIVVGHRTPMASLNSWS